MCGDWRPISEAKTDGTEIIGMDANGRIRGCWYFTRSSRTQGWVTIDSCRDFKPEYFIPCPDRRPVLVAMLQARQQAIDAKRAGHGQ
jgi:hypothetical protein